MLVYVRKQHFFVSGRLRRKVYVTLPGPSAVVPLVWNNAMFSPAIAKSSMDVVFWGTV